MTGLSLPLSVLPGSAHFVLSFNQPNSSAKVMSASQPCSKFWLFVSLPWFDCQTLFEVDSIFLRWLPRLHVSVERGWPPFASSTLANSYSGHIHFGQFYSGHFHFWPVLLWSGLNKSNCTHHHIYNYDHHHNCNCNSCGQNHNDHTIVAVTFQKLFCGCGCCCWLLWLWTPLALTLPSPPLPDHPRTPPSPHPLLRRSDVIPSKKRWNLKDGSQTTSRGFGFHQKPAKDVARSTH